MSWLDLSSFRCERQVNEDKLSGAGQPGQELVDVRVLLAAFLAILYLPFVYNYGYSRLAGIEYIDLPSFWCAARAVFRFSLSPYKRDVIQAIMPSQNVFQYLYPPHRHSFWRIPSLISYKVSGRGYTRSQSHGSSVSPVVSAGEAVQAFRADGSLVDIP